MSSLVLCAIAAERQHAHSEIEEAARRLESRVRTRTRELGEARRVAEDANRAKSTFLASMSHEIRTPMIGVTGMLEVLGRTELTDAQRQMVATAETSAHSLLQIIGDILDFSKIEAGRLELAPSTFELPPLVAGAAETFMPIAAGKGLLLTWSVDERLADAHIGDPLRLRQIISNFLSNAVKFTEVGGIDVAARVLENGDGAQTVELAVVDSGIGVSAEQQRRLFEEFAQADAATARRFGGTGLGLAICKRLAVLMGGEVTMQSEPGVGTTMRLTVPLPVGDPAAVEPAAGSASVPRVARPKPSREEAEREGSLLLLVEDHPVSRRVLTQQLDVVGFHADGAQDGQEAFELFLTGRYGLVLTDLHMPRMDGYELARAIRRHEQDTGAARTPIITLTADVMKGEPERCLAAGMDDFAAKPTTIQVLAAKLQRWLPQLDWPAASQPAVEQNGAGFGGAALDDLTGGDEQLLISVMRDFVSATNADVDALAEAIGAQDHARVRRSAHRIVGASRIVGAVELAALATQLEQAAAQSGDWRDLERLVQRLEAAAARIAGATDRLSSAGSAPSA
jgi:signal transduction histidine kinase/CheY-like chemotaxis protein/HPt (histidine-containing phosphotransfer) domain-containing protein